MHIGYLLGYWVKPEKVGNIQIIETLECHVQEFWMLSIGNLLLCETLRKIYLGIYIVRFPTQIYIKKKKYLNYPPPRTAVKAIPKCRFLFIHSQKDWIRVTFTWLGQDIQLATTGNYILGNICNAFLQEIQESCRIPLNLGSKATDYFAKRHLCYLKPFFSFSLYQTQHSTSVFA